MYSYLCCIYILRPPPNFSVYHIYHFIQVLQLTAMPTLAKAVVESFLTMLDAQGLNRLSSAAQIAELESTAANTVTMLESGVWVRSCCNHSFKDMCSIFIFFFGFDWYYIVATNCTDGQIRLRGGSNNREGRVEICINRIWGTICDTYWDYREAQVICRQLGFPSIGKFIPYLFKQNACKLNHLSGHVNKLQELKCWIRSCVANARSFSGSIQSSWPPVHSLVQK